MNWLLTFLLAYLLPGVDDPEEPVELDEPEEPVDPDEPTDPDEPADPEEPADPDAESSDEPAPRETRAKAWQATLRERAQKAERDLATARAELEAARRPQQPQQPHTPTQEQVLWQQEEATLNNPEATDWQKYAIQANRSARQATSRADHALAQAQDIADRTAFQAIATDKPKTFAAYKDKVEAKVQELRARGQNVPREAILKMMLGEDMLAGKLRTSEKVKPKAPAARRAPASDVPATGRGRVSESEARAKRLENIRI